MAAGADPNAANDEGLTPLMTQGDPASIEALLAAGARIDAVDHQGWGVLHHHASSYGALPLLELLLQRGADPTVRDRSGKLPLDLAREMPAPDSRVIVLLEAGIAARGKGPWTGPH